MSQRLKELLSLPYLPARLTRTETALILRVTEDDVTRLVALGFLSPLGKPAPSAPKYFAAVIIRQCANDPIWLSRATQALSAVWAAKNRKRKKPITAIQSRTISPSQKNPRSSHGKNESDT